MTSGRLILNSLRFHWRASLSVLFGAAFACMILSGALAIGDSVRYTLREQALARLGRVEYAIDNPGRFFRADLAMEISTDTHASVAPALHIPATAAQPDNGRQSNQVQVYGVDTGFWELVSSDPTHAQGPVHAAPDISDTVILNRELADHLQARVGDAIVLRLDKPGLMSRDAPLSTTKDDAVAARLTVLAIVDDVHGGRFGLQANQTIARNAFVPFNWLQEKLDQPGRANMLIAGSTSTTPTAPIAAEALATAVRKNYALADSELELRPLATPNRYELRSRHVFLDPATAIAGRNAGVASQGVLAYFVNELRVGEKTTPYSMVAALEQTPGTALFPTDMRPDEILINAWLAEDLAGKPGDWMDVTYYVMGPMRQLVEQKTSFTIRAILPMDHPACDRSLMPDYPGIADTDNCRDWDPGIPLNLDKIRDKDEAYWKTYRGTPKAFVTLAAGQALWNNHFGDLTALRYSVTPAQAAQIENTIRRQLDPAAAGLQFRPVRAEGLAASANGQDFGGLFLGLSFFLILAALILLGLMFSFALQQRAPEIGVLLALGFTPAAARRLFLAEGLILAVLGTALGTVGGVVYTRVVLQGLSTLWSGAVNTTELQFHVEATTLLTGAACSLLVALGAMVLVLRKQFKQPARELLNLGAETQPPGLPFKPRGRIVSLTLAILCALSAAGLLAAAQQAAGPNMESAFFGVGALLLVSGLAGCFFLLTARGPGAASVARSFFQLSLRNTTLRRSRSLATITLLACGCFLVIAVGAHQDDATHDADQSSSGTGGFRLYAETSLPVFHDLNSPAGREAYALDATALHDAKFVALRVHPGDDASCLNLNRAQRPRLLGVNPVEFDRRNAFSFIETAPKVAADHPWLGLTSFLVDAGMDTEIPAIGDEATVFWALGKSVGDTLDYTDQRGQVFKIRIVGMLRNSILQGSLIVSEEALVGHFPAESGYNLLLVDAPTAQADTVTAALTRGLRNNGIDLMPAAERLRLFSRVENTYLAIFGIIGGLGMLLGTAGLGLVLLRNVLERHSELAILRAVGFTTGSVERLLLYEHSLLLALGLAIGIGSALVAVAPSLHPQAGAMLLGSLTWMLAAMLAVGLVSLWIAAKFALRGPLLNALRNE